MSTKLPLLLAFLLTSLTAFSQYNPIQFGLQLSPSFSYMTTDNNLIESDGTNLGLKLGLIAEYFFQDNYSIHTGINVHFGSGGALRYDEQFTSVDIWRESLAETLTNPPTPTQLSGKTFDYNLQFVEVPLGLTLRTREFGYVRYFVQPAFTLGIVSGSRGSIENASFIDSGEKFKIGPEVNALNLSWGLGGGIEYAISTSSSLIAGLGFQSGFLDLTTDNDTQLMRDQRSPAEDNSKAKVNSISILLGIMF
ncbi:porin family protein [Neolewinella litorea]|uniref:PorT family protein n=1 Tax=Neolewinella litorea TaxID=2562452 RepID=A0A4S4NAP8_9BACT|nr:porin family protein [Neolewinella litorea]THH36424.1 PorT family protein [Neolewinella litorea]